MSMKIRFGRIAVSFGAMLAISLFITCSIASAAAHSFLSELSHAKGNIKRGALDIHPGLKITETWDDNIFNTSEDEKDDFINTFTPGLLLSIGERHRFEIGYAVDFLTYADYTNEDYTSQAALAGFHFDFVGGLKLDLSDQYTDTRDVRPEVGQLRAAHRTNDINAVAKYTFPGSRLSVEISYSQFYLKYDGEENRIANRMDYIPGFAVFYKFLPKTSLVLEYAYTDTDYIDSEDVPTTGTSTVDELNDADSESHSVSVGLLWDATEKVDGKLTAGWDKKEYDNEIDPDGNRYDDESTWIVSGDLTYRATEKTSISLMLIRSVDETIYSGNPSEDIADASHYTNTGGNVFVRFRVDPKITLRIGAGYSEQDYNNLNDGDDSRRDDTVSIEGGIDYNIQDWLYAGLGYSYLNTDSNDEERDEKHNRGFVSLTVAF